MRVKAIELMKDRGGYSGSYGCPVHIPVEACLKLYEEVGVNPEPHAVGVLGDILENFAITIIKNSNNKRITVEHLEQSLRKVLGQ